MAHVNEFMKYVAAGSYLWPMLEQFLNHISKYKLFKTADKILLAVSGGLDSMVMLHLCKEAGLNIGVAHCNFKLRGEESNQDEYFVKGFCNENEIPFYVTQFNTQEYSKQKGLSIQMAARELRYTWFKQIIDKNEFAYIATAHHANDSIETALLNFVHGGSLEGYEGIPVKNGRIIRPILFATKEQIISYAIANNISWREDSSNLTDDYQRNFIRHQLVPQLKNLNPSLEGTFLTGQRKIRDELDFTNHQIEVWKAKHLLIKGNTVFIEKKELGHSFLLWKCIRELNFNFYQCEDVLRSIQGQPGKFFLSVSHQLVIDREHLIVSPISEQPVNVLIEMDSKEVIRGRRLLKIESIDVKKPSSDQAEVLLDANKIAFPLIWRGWRQGDFFYPLGMEQKKKLSDFLIDTKVPLNEKQDVTVLESDGKIVWVVGYRIDNRFKLTSETKSAISFKLI